MLGKDVHYISDREKQPIPAAPSQRETLVA